MKAVVFLAVACALAGCVVIRDSSSGKSQPIVQGFDSSQYVRVKTIPGKGTMSSEPFATSTKPFWISWKAVNGGKLGSFGLAIMRAGNRSPIAVVGDDCDVEGRSEGGSYVYADPGEYYVESITFADWEAAVYDRKPTSASSADRTPALR